MQQMVDQTCRRLEKTVFTKRFSLLGALQLDGEVRALCSFFTNLTEQAVRHKFARLFEMASFLNLESVEELREVHNELKAGHLTPEELKKLLGCRVDFHMTDADFEMLA